MSKGLKVGLSIAAIGCLIPILTAVLTLRSKPVYHTLRPETDQFFVQLTWQEKPVVNVEHMLIFLEKPPVYKAEAGLDVVPPEKTEGYFILPRGVFFKEDALLKPVKKEFRRQKKDVCVWIVHRGKAFPVELSIDQNNNIKEFISFEDHSKAEATQLGLKMKDSAVWKTIVEKTKDFIKQMEEGKIDFEPRKKRSEFMTF